VRGSAEDSGDDVAGRVRSVTIWPVKSMGGGTSVQHVRADRGGLAGDRAHALVDRRPLRDGHVLSARNVPGILRWSAGSGGSGEPAVTAPDGRAWTWDEPGLRDALRDDLGIPVDLSGPGSYSDLEDSILVTTTATHEEVERRFGRPLDVRRWRTNLHLDLSSAPFAEHGWEGRRLQVGQVVLRLLHPCRRCTIPTWAPGGRERTPELLAWFHRRSDGRFGINARVEVPGVVRVGDRVTLR
jgi:uncharacterized protein